MGESYFGALEDAVQEVIDHVTLRRFPNAGGLHEYARAIKESTDIVMRVLKEAGIK